MKPIHCLVAVLVLGAWTTQACLAKTARSMSKATTGIGAAASGGSRQGSGAHGVNDTVRNHTGGKIDAGNPIDTRIAEPRRGPLNNPKPIDTKKIGVVGVPSRPPQTGTVPGPLRLPQAPPSLPKVPSIANTAIATSRPAGVTRNAVGATTYNAQAAATGIGRKGPGIAPGGGGIQAGLPKAAETKVTGASPVAGTTATFAGRVNAPAIARINTAPPAVAANHGTINGTTIGRPVSGPAVIGGPQKNVAAGINGTGYRPKHP